MTPRRRALAAYGALAAFELVETVVYLWLRSDVRGAAKLGAIFGLDPETEMVRANILLGITSVLTIIAGLLVLTLRRRAAVGLGWRRLAFLAFGLYALWALVQQFVLRDPSALARAWLLADTIVAGGLGTLGYLQLIQAPPQEAEDDVPFAVYDPIAPVNRDPSGLEWQDVETGRGPLASPGRTAVVHYTGWLTNGRKFDSSRDRGNPLEFPVGAGRVIRAWDEGVQTMRQGGLRRLIVPPELAYGQSGAGAIPANATLVFEVELLDVR